MYIRYSLHLRSKLMYTVTLIFNKDKDKVLMCWHNKQKMWNYVGGKVGDTESGVDASYRELEEETGIAKDDITLSFVRCENTSTGYSGTWSLYVMAGVLDRDVELKPEKNKLKWIDIDDVSTILCESFGYGNCFLFLREALKVLRLEKELMKTYW